MRDSERRMKELVRQQLDRRLEKIRNAGVVLEPPRDGWISALRHALGMTQAHLGRRMGMSRQAVSQLEQREADGSATLNALEQAAQALGGRLVYAIVPERSISETLARRAMELAEQMTSSVRHTMRLEDQEPSRDLEERTRELAEELLSSPKRLWTGRGE